MSTDVERVTRPDGKVWRFDPRYGRRVRREDTEDGPVVLVLRTHDLERAARMAEVRWSALHPGEPIPIGAREWRRFEIASVSTTNGPDFNLNPSTGTETKSIPVVAFRLVEGEEVA